MKLLDKITKRFTKTASETVKKEVKKTAIDLLPTIVGVVSMIVGIVIFKEVTNDSDTDMSPAITHTSITTNNYFFNEVSEETISKILDLDGR